MGKLSGRRILITGSNRGLGLEMVRQLRKFNPEQIFATCRSPEKAHELAQISREDDRVHLLQIDVAEPSSFTRAVEEVHKLTQGKGIHNLINNAGIFVGTSQSLEDVKMETMLQFLGVNTLGPLFLTQALLPLLIASNKGESEPGLIVNFASRLGSISDNTSGGLYASRCSRSATNAATMSMSLDLKDKNILVFGMNPGWVKTDQGGPEAKLEVDAAVSQILQVIDSANQEHAGRLVQYDGQILEW